MNPENRVDAVKVLLALGADVHARTECQDTTSCFAAAYADSVDAAQVLLAQVSWCTAPTCTLATRTAAHRWPRLSSLTLER